MPGDVSACPSIATRLRLKGQDGPQSVGVNVECRWVRSEHALVGAPPENAETHLSAASVKTATQ